MRFTKMISNNETSEKDEKLAPASYGQYLTATTMGAIKFPLSSWTTTTFGFEFVDGSEHCLEGDRSGAVSIGR